MRRRSTGEKSKALQRDFRGLGTCLVELLARALHFGGEAYVELTGYEPAG